MQFIKPTNLFACCLLLSMTLPVQAASQCKGLTQTDCSAQATCSWVDAYQRKDGKKVKAFCRAKAKTKSTSK